MFFSSIKEIDRLVKEINWLLSKVMSNIYLKVTIEKKWHIQNFDFLNLKSSSPAQFLGSSNSRRHRCNSKSSDLEAKLCVAFLLFYFERNNK